MTRVVAALVLLAALSGCMVGERTSAPDSDGDKLPDETELGGWNLTVYTTVFVCFSDAPVEPVLETRFVKSNELREDTDADGVTDLDEYFNRGDPTRKDTDGDNLTDGEEWELRKTATFFHGPRLALERMDSDEDCLTDAEEIHGFDIQGIGHRTSDPTIDDSDHDGFSDAWEFRRSFSDPMNPDTDGDGARDRLDLDPLHDVGLRVEFTSLTAKDLPSASARVRLHWMIPTQEPSQSSGQSPTFVVHEGEPMTPEAAASPGEQDVGDEKGGTDFVFEFWITVVDDRGGLIGFLDINPHRPGQPVQVRYDVATDSWQFGSTNGYTAYGRATSLETSQARITFMFEDFALD